jgi:uncharacterized protein YjbI with pentapeptide repeats
MSRLHSWWRKIKQHLSIVTGIIIGLSALIAFTWSVYKFGWNWTGLNAQTGPEMKNYYYPAKTLWDWMQLLGVLAIPAAVGLGTLWFTTKQNQTSNQIAQDQQREDALEAYIDKISEHLLEKGLRTSLPGDEKRDVARVRTLTVLGRLDITRKNTVLSFLRESGLVTSEKGKSIVTFSGIKWEDADLSYVDLRNTDFSGANLSRALLVGANLSGVDLSGALLVGANLSGAHLDGANLSGTHLDGANLTEAELGGANLSGAGLSRANLSKAFLDEANLSKALLLEANLNFAHFRGADLSGAYLVGAKLRTDHRYRQSGLSEAKSLKGAFMPDGSVLP